MKELSKGFSWILVIALLAVLAYLYHIGMLGFLGLKNDPYKELRRNIGGYYPPTAEDGLWGAVDRVFQPQSDEEHARLFHSANAFIKGYNLAPDGWTFEMALADDFETFYEIHGPMLSSQVRTGEYI